LCPCFNSTSLLDSLPSALRDQTDTNSPNAQIATASEPETGVRRITTIPNGYAQMTMNRMYPSQIGIRASLPPQSWPSAVGLMERALMFQYTPRKTQQARISIAVSMTSILSPQSPIANPTRSPSCERIPYT
jgi:hypothetical protein